MLGELGDHTVTPELADTVGALVNEAEGDLAIEGVATSAIRSLGQLGGAAAAGAAARAAADTRHPAYHRVAIESLGQMCDPDQGAKALAAARAGRDPRWQPPPKRPNNAAAEAVPRTGDAASLGERRRRFPCRPRDALGHRGPSNFASRVGEEI